MQEQTPKTIQVFWAIDCQHYQGDGLQCWPPPKCWASWVSHVRLPGKCWTVVSIYHLVAWLLGQTRKLPGFQGLKIPAMRLFSLENTWKYMRIQENSRFKLSKWTGTRCQPSAASLTRDRFRTPSPNLESWVSQAWICSLPTGGGGPSSFNSQSVSPWTLPKTWQCIKLRTSIGRSFVFCQTFDFLCRWRLWILR